jgi:2-oxoisovalerate dehydrogenase E1 component alpha subunit
VHHEPTGPLSEDGLAQLLTPAGERVSHPDLDAFAVDLDADRLRAMYRDMVLSRRLDTESTALQRQGELALFVPAVGQEAAQIGSAHATRSTDHVFPSYREHAIGMVRGVDPVEILRFFRGVDHGGWDSEAHNFHLYTVVIGAHTLHATGYAMGLTRDGVASSDDGEAAIVYFGDGSTSQGDVNESMVFAAVNAAPLVFFCQNNQWAISVPTTRQAIVPLADRAPGFGIPSLRIDGNDVIASYAATRWALERARTGQGPTYVEALTYRLGAHTTSDDPTRYRTAAEEQHWRDRDPIDRLRTYLTSTGDLSDAFLAEVDAEAEALGERVRHGVRTMQAPDVSTLFEHVYATEHAQVSDDAAWFADYQSTLGGTR